MFSTISLVKRNIRNYLRDKVAVFFSFLSVIILLSLYLLFLGNSFRPNGLDGVMADNQITFLVYAQLIPGLLVINSVSIPLGNLGTMINDFEYRQIDGFLVTPIKRYKVLVAYYLSSFLITIVISLTLLIAAFLLISVTTGVYVLPMTYLQSILLTILFSFISTAVMVFITSFINSVNAFGAVAGVFGTVIGFVSGIYMPLFILPKFMSNVASLVPFTHMNILLKRIILPQAFELMDPANFDSQETYETVLNEFKVSYGYNELGILGFDVPLYWIMIGSTLLAVGLLVISSYLMQNKIKK